MRLIRTDILELEEFFDANIPKYAILSHTWEKDEVSFQDMQGRNAKYKAGYTKIMLTRLSRMALDMSGLIHAVLIRAVVLSFLRQLAQNRNEIEPRICSISVYGH